jgi:hypothetical protein
MRVQDGASASAAARDANRRTARRRVGPPLRRPLLGVACAGIRAGGRRTHAGRAAGRPRGDRDPRRRSRRLDARVHRGVPRRARDRRRPEERRHGLRCRRRGFPAVDPAARARPSGIRRRHAGVLRLCGPWRAGRARGRPRVPGLASTRDEARACRLRARLRLARDARDHDVPDRPRAVLPPARCR